MNNNQGANKGSRSITDMTSTSSTMPAANGWWVYLLQGLAAHLLGLVLLSSPLTAALAVPLVLGVILLVQSAVLTG